MTHFVAELEMIHMKGSLHVFVQQAAAAKALRYGPLVLVEILLSILNRRMSVFTVSVMLKVTG